MTGNFSVSQRFKEVLDLFTAINPIYRCDAIELIQHPYFQTVPRPLKKNPYLADVYYLWLRYKNIDNIGKFEQYLIANDLLPYLPPVLQIPNVVEPACKEQNGVVILNRVQINIEGLLQEIKKDRDTDTTTVQSKLFSDEITVKPESFMGKITTIFRSKSAKSTHSESSMRSKNSENFNSFYKKYKSLVGKLRNGFEEFIQVGSEGFPHCVRQALWKKILKIPCGYLQSYEFLYCTRQIEQNKQISLDIPRCHQYNLFLSSVAGKKYLESLLKLWFSQHVGVKYSQGLDSIAAVCVCCFEQDKAAAYHSFDKIVQKYLLKVIVHEEFIGNFLLILRNLVSFIDPVLSQHMNAHNINPEMYATSWLLTLYSRKRYLDVFSLASVCVLWDLLLQKPAEFMFFIAFSILQQFRIEILENSQSEIITMFSGINGHIDLEKCMKDALEVFERTPAGICELVYPKAEGKVWEKELELEIAQASRAPMISLESCSQISQDLVFVDTRASEEYNKLRVSGSINLPLKTGNDSSVLPTIKLTQAQLQGLKTHAKGKVIVLIGDNSLRAHSVISI